jgi:hypothetical protein
MYQQQQIMEMQKRMMQQHLAQQQLSQQQNQQNRQIRPQQDIERTRLLFNQQFINKNNKIVNPRSDEEDEDEEDEDDSDDEYENDTEKKTRQIKMQYQELPHFVVISSLDRNWEIDNPGKSQYDFQVKFAPSSNTIVNKPLYVNNPTVPATSSQASQGQRGNPNISGWFASDGTFYQAYEPNEPYGAIVEYEKIIEVGQKGLALDNSFKNITSIELVSAMFPSVQRQIDYHPSLMNNTVDETFYTMEIDEINDFINGTSKEFKNAFAILTPMIRIYDIVNRSGKAIEYKPIGFWSKTFTPAPLSSLTNLTIKIKNPAGTVLENMNDTLDVKFIYQYQSDPTDDRTNILVIETTKYFSEVEYKPTDTIVFKNYSYRNPLASNVQQFNDFMNRQKGHKILYLSNDDSNKFLKNRIHIARPAYLDTITGGLTEESWYTSFKTTLNDETTIGSITEYDTGRFINIDLQTIYFFKITTKEQSMASLESERV